MPLDLETLAQWGEAHLQALVAFDSQSDERNPSLPSSEGQRVLAAFLADFFQNLGYSTEIDPHANLLVTLPSRLPAGQTAPFVALMAHLDTSRGTQAIPALLKRPRWDGSTLPYPENPRLTVNVEMYPGTRAFVGEDLLYGPGIAPFGLDDKLGLSELMTLAHVLASEPSIQHGPLLLVFRPDEEIGRMAVIEGAAQTLKQRGVQYGYTADGMESFEINTENFYASRAKVRFSGRPLPETPQGDEGQEEVLRLRLFGVKSHGATAKAEGYRNATRFLACALQPLIEDLMVGDLLFLGLQSDHASEVQGDALFVLRGSANVRQKTKERLLASLAEEIEPHRPRGAFMEIVASPLSEAEKARLAAPSDEHHQMLAYLWAFLESKDVTPLLSEESEAFEGYSNPFFSQPSAGQAFATLDIRLRSFSQDELRGREAHVRRLAASLSPSPQVEIQQQYINMGPALAPYPELVTWAEDAARLAGFQAVRRPIRGGTGVDPFLAQGIPIANLGTGYFAPESEKEFTSRQTLARHVLWLVSLVQRFVSGPEEGIRA